MKVTCSNHVSMSHLNWEFNSQHASQPNGREVFFTEYASPLHRHSHIHPSIADIIRELPRIMIFQTHLWHFAGGIRLPEGLGSSEWSTRTRSGTELFRNTADWTRTGELKRTRSRTGSSKTSSPRWSTCPGPGPCSASPPPSSSPGSSLLASGTSSFSPMVTSAFNCQTTMWPASTTSRTSHLASSSL